MKLPVILVLAAAAVSACTAMGSAPEPVPAPQTSAARPLDTLPAETSLTVVRRDLFETAEERFGAALFETAREAPTYLIVKRFVGMAPPPPPGADVNWIPIPAAAMLARRAEGWMVATRTGWRPADADAAAEMDRIIADPGFWREPAYTAPCPDFGASLLLLKASGNAETVRNSTCMSNASRMVEAALRA
jgi:hypothetical protein